MIKLVTKYDIALFYILYCRFPLHNLKELSSNFKKIMLILLKVAITKRYLIGNDPVYVTVLHKFSSSVNNLGIFNSIVFNHIASLCSRTNTKLNLKKTRNLKKYITLILYIYIYVICTN